MSTATPTLSTPFLAAVDISKQRHEVLIEVPGNKRRRRLSVLNRLDDFNRLIDILAAYGRPVHVAFEATGNNHRALAWHLGAAGFETKLVSSVALAHTREALHNSWDKNDPKDAQVILHMMTIGAEQFYHDPLVRGTNDIQELSKTHDIVSKSKTELWQRGLTGSPGLVVIGRGVETKRLAGTPYRHPPIYQHPVDELTLAGHCPAVDAQHRR